MKKILSIAGSDCSGGAGIQADLKTITAHNMYGMTVITALTAQNTTGVYGVQEAQPEFVGLQLDCIMQDIFPDSENAMDALIEKLIPLATIITPNIPEAECLSGISIETKEDMQKAAEKLAEKYGGNILIKGGHLENSADDLLYSNREVTWFSGLRIDNPNTHGTGCTLSSAIACHLAAGYDVKTSIKLAKEYLTGALKDQLDLGKGSGPLNHCFSM